MIQEIQANQKTNHQLTTLISTGIYIPAINAKVTLTTNNATDTAFLKIFTPNAKPSLYNPLKDSEQLVLKAVNLGLMCMDKKNTQEAITAYYTLY